MKSCMVNNDNGMFWQIFSLSRDSFVSLYDFDFVQIYQKFDIKKSSTFCSKSLLMTTHGSIKLISFLLVGIYSAAVLLLVLCGKLLKTFGTIWKEFRVKYFHEISIEIGIQKIIEYKFNNNLVFLSCILNKSVMKNV